MDLGAGGAGWVFDGWDRLGVIGGGGGALITYQSLLQSRYSVTMYSTSQDPCPSASKMSSQ